MGGARLVYNCKALAEPVAKRGHGAFCVWREPRAGKETEVSNHRCILLVAYGGPHQQENLVIPSSLRYLPWQGLYYATEPFRVQAPGESAPLALPPPAALAKLKAFSPPPEGPLVLVLLSPADGPLLFKGGGGGALEPNFSFSFSFGGGWLKVLAEVEVLTSVSRDKICLGGGATSSTSEGAREV